MSVSETETAYWEMIRRSAGTYPPQAFGFVQEGLRHTVEQLTEARERANELAGGGSEAGARHVNGQELCLGLRDFAVSQYGLLARTVLDQWNIRRTEDFGRIVFMMVDAALLRKTDEDNIEDFSGVYDFDEVFGRELEQCESDIPSA